MMTPTYDWIREIKSDLKNLDRIPLTGNSPPFPWEQLSSQLTRALDCAPLVIQPGEIMWRSKETLDEGLGKDLFSSRFPSLPSEEKSTGPSQSKN